MPPNSKYKQQAGKSGAEAEGSAAGSWIKSAKTRKPLLYASIPYSIIAVVTFAFQTFVRSSQCGTTADCMVSYV